MSRSIFSELHLSGRQTLLVAGTKPVFEEKIIEAKNDHPELRKLLAYVCAQDTVVVCKLDRLVRSTSHFVDIVETLRDKKASFYSLAEPWV